MNEIKCPNCGEVFKVDETAASRSRCEKNPGASRPA